MFYFISENKQEWGCALSGYLPSTHHDTHGTGMVVSSQ